MILRSTTAADTVGVDLTPVIDLVFLLLVFFLAATTFHQTEREMNIALPKTAAAGPISMALKEIVINVRADGTAVVGGRVSGDEDLRALLTQSVTSNPEQKVSVRGDQAASYASIARVLDICKGAGIREPFLDTVPLR